MLMLVQSNPVDVIRSSIRSATLKSCIALSLCASILCGCTAAQKQSAVQIVAEINTHIPEVVAAADTVAATIAALVPADAVLIGVASSAFNAGAATLQALTASYIANPTASVLTQIQTAITTLETQINTATLNAEGIKNVQLQQTVLAALKGLLTVVTVVFALISPTLSSTQVSTLTGVHITRLRPYMDERQLEAVAAQHGTTADAFFRYAAAQGL